MKAGYRANLRCGCKQVGPVRMSSTRPTLQDCLRELGRLIQQDHGPTCVAAAQKLQAAEKDAADASTKRSHDEGAQSWSAQINAQSWSAQINLTTPTSNVSKASVSNVVSKHFGWQYAKHLFTTTLAVN